MTNQEKIEEVKGRLTQLVNIYNKNAESQTALLREITELQGGLKVLTELQASIKTLQELQEPVAESEVVTE